MGRPDQRRPRTMRLTSSPKEEREIALDCRRRYRKFRYRLREQRVRCGILPETLLPYLRADRLTAAAIRVLSYLAIRSTDSGECWRTEEDMATALGLDVRSIQRGLKQLQDERLIQTVRFTRKRYFLLPFGPQAQQLDP